MSRSLDRLGRLATSEIRASLDATDTGERLHARRRAAEILVEARQHFTTADGESDLLGRSRGYRDWVGDVYASIPADERETVQAAIRYHVGNVARETLRGEDLAALGLSPLSPKERSKAQRDGKAALLSSIGGGSPAYVVVAIRRLLDSVTSEALDSSTPEERRIAIDGLAEVSKIAGQIARKAESRRK